jgi:uncharacterized protein (TIGR03085 family)
MRAMNWARQERQDLADLFAAVGPEAPTLDEGWTTADLAAHLVIRERRPDAAVGILVRPLAAHSEKVRQEVARRPWAEVVELVRSGPPRWSPTSLDAVDRVANTVEFFVHHEDVRRATDGWEPRPVDGDLERELWRRLKPMSRILARKAPVGVVLRRTNGDEVVAKKPGPDGAVVTVAGPASELLLFTYGRQAHARVEIIATDDATAAILAARLGF